MKVVNLSSKDVLVQYDAESWAIPPGETTAAKLKTEWAERLKFHPRATADAILKHGANQQRTLAISEE